MSEIRDCNGRLTCKVDPSTGLLEIINRDMKVLLLLPADVPVQIQRHGTLTQVSRTVAGDIHSDSHTLMI